MSYKKRKYAPNRKYEDGTKTWLFDNTDEKTLCRIISSPVYDITFYPSCTKDVDCMSGKCEHELSMYVIFNRLFPGWRLKQFRGTFDFNKKIIVGVGL